MARPYRLRYTSRAVKDINRLDKVTKKRLARSLERFSRDPTKHMVKLVKSELIGQYRFRVGNYRIIFDRQGHDIIILRIMHRREVYQR